MYVHTFTTVKNTGGAHESLRLTARKWSMFRLGICGFVTPKRLSVPPKKLHITFRQRWLACDAKGKGGGGGLRTRGSNYVV